MKEEWEKVRDYYIQMLKNPGETQKEHIEYRIECINDLLYQEEMKEFEHFK